MSAIGKSHIGGYIVFDGEISKRRARKVLTMINQVANNPDMAAILLAPLRRPSENFLLTDKKSGIHGGPFGATSRAIWQESPTYRAVIDGAVNSFQSHMKTMGYSQDTFEKVRIGYDNV